MYSSEHINIIKDSQNLQKKLIDSVFTDYEILLQQNTPEEAKDFIISLYDKEVYDCVEVKIDTISQTGFFTIAQSINPICHFWYFLESIIIGNETSYWHQDQEGPEACFVVSKLNDDKVRVTLISYGWWEFNKKQKGLKKIYNNYYQISLDIVCSVKEFITQIYNIMMNIKYPTPEDDYDPWYNAPKDSKIINEYISKINAPIIRDKQNTLNNEVKFSIDWNFGIGNFNNDDIEVDTQLDIENTLNNIWQNNDGIIQIGVLYKCNGAKICHTMELSEIKWISDDLLEKVKNNEEAKYFDSHCSCDFEFASLPIDNKKIRFIITDCNNEPIVLFDNIISKDNFLTEITHTFNEINIKIKEIVSDYSKRHNLSLKQGKELLNLLYEWR